MQRYVAGLQDRYKSVRQTRFRSQLVFHNRCNARLASAREANPYAQTGAYFFIMIGDFGLGGTIAMKLHTLTILVVAGLVLFGATAHAADKNWLVRGRILNVSPNDKSGSVTGIPGSGVGVDSDTTLELDFTYLFTTNWGAELILGTSKHDLNGQGSIGTLGKIGSARTLPPTVTAVYQFTPNAAVRPYAGIGINYTRFYDANTSSSLNAALGPTTAKLDSSWGMAGQVGVDMDITKDWFINLDAKYIRMDTTIRLDSSGTTRTVNVDLNPWFFGLGIGTRF